MTMTDLTLYTHPFSRGRVVRWMLEELQVPYNVEVKEFGTSMKAPDYLAINPMGKVPAIKHGDTIVTEVCAICAYLADRFPEKGLAPASGSPERGSYYRWLFFMAGPFEMAGSARTFNWKLDKDTALAAGCGMLEDSVNALEQATANASPYLCGEQFTAADLVVASYLGWQIGQKSIEDRPAFRQYLDRIATRPAGIRAGQLDDALMNVAAA
jgi:glutathione S-transferase